MSLNKNRYITSPLGFTECGKDYLIKIRNKFKSFGFEVNDPWDYNNNQMSSEDIARKNKELIESSDILFAILDGVDVDSGTASEIGFAYALKKRIYGLRTDIRKSGEKPDVIINLQVQYWIEDSGGRIFRKLKDISLDYD